MYEQLIPHIGMNCFGRNCLIGVVHCERPIMTPTGSDELTTTARNLTIYR